MNDFNLYVGKCIKEKRTRLNLTREKLSGMANISDKFLYEIEVGNKGMSAETLFKLAYVLELSIDSLLYSIDMEKIILL